MIMQNVGARTTAVASAREALHALRTSPQDVLVSDIGMPDEDGFALIAQVRKLGGAVARIPALALTGYAQTANSDALMPGKFQRIALKPIEPQRLVALVAALVTERRLAETS